MKCDEPLQANVRTLDERAERDLARVEAASAENQTSRGAPEPLRRPVPPPKPYPLDSLGPILAPAAKSLRRVMQAPDAVCGASVLAAASLATQGLADVAIDGRTLPLSIWMLTVAESGERKSAVDAEAMRPARAYEKELTKIYENELKKYKAAQKEKNASGPMASGEAEESEPLLPCVTAADFTAEGLFKLLRASRPTIGAFTDEAALVFGGHGMTKETVMRTAGTLSKLWDRGELDRVRSGDGAAKLYGRRFALHLMAQPVIAERALSDDVLAGQGFLARCLLAWPEGTAGTRKYVNENLRIDLAMQNYENRLLELHHKPLSLAEGELQELEPRRLKLSDGARGEWVNFYNWVEERMTPGREFATVKAWASKTAEQALRIAGVLTLVENPDATTIDKDTVVHAAVLASWHLSEARRLSGTAELSTEVRDAEALLNWCHETGRQKLHSSAALQFGPSRIRERSIFKAAVDELVRAGWAKPVNGGELLDGKHRRHVWEIVPAKEGG